MRLIVAFIVYVQLLTASAAHIKLLPIKRLECFFGCGQGFFFEYNYSSCHCRLRFPKLVLCTLEPSVTSLCCAPVVAEFAVHHV